MEYKRLTERVKNTSSASDKYSGELVQYKYGKDKTLAECLVDILGRLAELEDMIEDGQAAILPCKVGDNFYIIIPYSNDYVKHTCCGFTIEDGEVVLIDENDSRFYPYNSIYGHTIVFSEDEAKLSK